MRVEIKESAWHGRVHPHADLRPSCGSGDTIGSGKAACISVAAVCRQLNTRDKELGTVLPARTAARSCVVAAVSRIDGKELLPPDAVAWTAGRNRLWTMGRLRHDHQSMTSNQKLLLARVLSIARTSLFASYRRRSTSPMVLLGLLAPFCGQGPEAASKRQEPSCAQLDCSTGRIVDNGCSIDGRCLSCVNDCTTAPLEPK